ncbi:MAG: YceI family protein [Paracoccaceae bacterium]
MRHICLAVVAVLASALPLLAAPHPYVLEPDGSKIGFVTTFGADRITGDFPVTRADLALDFNQVSNCTIDVALDVGGARASFPFAAAALKGPKILNADAFPQMTFVSTSVVKEGDKARVIGQLTLRGVTRPVSLQAQILRQPGTAAGDLSHLVVHLTGQILRSDFGATGWADMVGDEVQIDIRARIRAAS